MCTCDFATDVSDECVAPKRLHNHRSDNLISNMLNTKFCLMILIIAYVSCSGLLWEQVYLS
jgi:hypothetical protein